MEIDLPLPEMSIRQPGGMGKEEGKDGEGPKVLNTAIGPKEPQIYVGNIQCAQGPSTVCVSQGQSLGC